MAVLLAQSLELEDGTRISQSVPVDQPSMTVTDYGIVLKTKSVTGKRDGDVDVFPWHTVKSFRTWRYRA
jgi:hypothetical protein